MLSNLDERFFKSPPCFFSGLGFDGLTGSLFGMGGTSIGSSMKGPAATWKQGTLRMHRP